MGKKFAFTTEGIGSRSYYLSKIRDGGNSVNKLKDLARKSWFDAKTAIDILEAEKLIENVAVGVYPSYALTAWGEQEAKRFDTWKGPGTATPSLPVPHTSQPAPGLNEHHTVPEVPDRPVQTIKPEELQLPPVIDAAINLGEAIAEHKAAEKPFADPIANKTPEVEKPAVNPKMQMNDGYLDAYHQLLHEQFGDQISFKEVLARMAA